MPIINISVRNKISKYLGNEPIVCKNSDYVLHFDLDEQWSPFAVKTVKIAYGESFIPVVFNGNECAMPKLPNTTLVGISLEAGDVRTAVPAWIECLPVLEDDVSEVPPPPENVYNQIMEMISSGVLTGARIVETVYMGTDANGGNVYKQIFDNGMESTFVAPKGIDAKVVLGDESGMAYEGSKGAQNRRDINRLYELAEGLSGEIAENAENIADVNEALSKSKPTKPETFKPHNFVSYDVAGNKLTDTGYSGTDIAENKENIRKNSAEITKNANNIQKNATDISGIKVNSNKMATDIAQNEIDISTLRVFANELSARLNAVANSTDVDLDQLSEIVAYIKSNKSLIDNITTNKVNVSDIVDNLTTEAKNKPLSAKQGVVLKALIDALSNKAVTKDKFGNVTISGDLYASLIDMGGSTAISAEGIDTLQVNAEEITAYAGWIGGLEVYAGENDEVFIGSHGIALAENAKIIANGHSELISQDGDFYLHGAIRTEDSIHIGGNYIAAPEFYCGENDEIHITDSEIALAESVALTRDGEPFALESYVNKRTEWDYVLDLDAGDGSHNIQNLSGNVLVKGGTMYIDEYIGSNINHLRFEGTDFQDQFSFYGSCGKISGIISPNSSISFGEATAEVCDCKVGSIGAENCYVHDIVTNNAVFYNCRQMRNIKVSGTATYTNCKYVDPFTCEKFGSGVPMIDGNGAVTFVESAEGGSYGS